MTKLERAGRDIAVAEAIVLAMAGRIRSHALKMSVIAARNAESNLVAARAEREKESADHIRQTEERSRDRYRREQEDARRKAEERRSRSLSRHTSSLAWRAMSKILKMKQGKTIRFAVPDWLEPHDFLVKVNTLLRCSPDGGQFVFDTPSCYDRAISVRCVTASK